MQNFIWITAFFVIYNIIYLLTGTRILSKSLSGWVYPINTVAIIVFLSFLNLSFYKERNGKGGNSITMVWIITLGIIVSVYLARFPLTFEYFQTFVFTILPIFLVFTVVSVVIHISKSEKFNALKWMSLIFPVVFLLVSYLVYFNGSNFWFLILSNTIFLFFAGLKYFSLYIENRKISLPEIPIVDPLEELGLKTKMQKDITRLLLEGKSYEEIASIRNVGRSTITSQASRIFGKFGLDTREDFVKMVRKHVDNK